MSRLAKQLLGAALVAGVFGGVFAFALKDENASAAGLELQAFGLVLLAFALVLAAGAAISSVGPEKGKALDIESTRTITGLVAVVAGIVAVSAIAIVTATLLGNSNKESAIAITTSALGIISTFVTAYLGIKATANTSDKATKAAAVLVDKLTNSKDPPGGEGSPQNPAQGGGAK